MVRLFRLLRSLLWDVFNVFFPSPEWVEKGRREVENDH